MTRTHALATAALAASLLGGGLTAASAQTLTLVGSVTGASPAFVYSYTRNSSIPLNQVTFNFADSDPFTGIVTTGPLTLTGMVTSAGLYTFSNLNTPLAANTNDVFMFTSPDAPGSTVGAVGISYSGSGVASINNVAPAPAVAPEPSQTAALGLGVLGLAGMAFTARRRALRA